MTGAGVVAACGSNSAPGPTATAGSGGASAGTGGSTAGGKGGGVSAGGGGASGHTGTAGTGGTPAEAGAAGDGSNNEGGAAGAAPELLGPYADVQFPADNLYDADKAMLGKVLFWDEQMSSDDTVACGTCHRTESGGSDPRAASPSAGRHPGADGILGTADDVHGAMGIKRCQITNGNVVYISDPVFGMNVQVTRRKPPSYLDAMLAPEIFWDGRAKDFKDPVDGTLLTAHPLEAQALGPPVGSAEMACDARTWTDVVAKLQTASPLALAHDLPADMRTWLDTHLDANGTYPALFRAVYGTPEISAKRVVFAIATHERRLMSSETPWDHYMAGEKTALSPAQISGWSKFQKVGCTTCHAPPLFSDKAFHNLGFIADSQYDLGRFEVTANAADKGRVKTATVRNVGLREASGLLHYGFGPGASLETLMAAYNNPPKLGNFDTLMIPLVMTDAEITDMIDFMRNGLTDPRVKAALPPFDRPKLGSEQ
ncbi:MAG TPA: cytochrome c peroxidase [Polyangiaceae bacterium]|nr:cytochrome c peroxidase [Polyangiaceae bacterium]